MTTESQRQQAETIAAEMAKLPGIASAVVDDWDDFGGFNLFIRLTTGGSNSSSDRSRAGTAPSGSGISLQSVFTVPRDHGNGSTGTATTRIRINYR